MPKLTRRVFTEFESAWNFTLCPKSFPIRVRIYVPRRQSFLPLNEMQEKMIALFVSDLRHCSQRLELKLHESPLEHCPSAFH